MPRVLASDMLANGLRTEFADTYEKIRNRQADSRLSLLMDLGVGATNRDHDFAYFEAAPHMEYWERNTTIPTAAMDSVSFNVPIYEWGRKVPWSKWDRKDDQTQTLMQMARRAGESAALLPERMFFDLIQGGTPSTLPSIPNAPDGVDMFNATDEGGDDRFGISNGNIVTGAGTTAAQVLSDLYDCIVRFKQFADGQGQPMLGDQTLESGFVIVHPVELTESMEEAFIQKRQVGTGGSTPSNLVLDASRNIELWGTSRLSDATDWFCFLKTPPKPATFFLDREGVQEFTALEGDNNSDSNRSKAEEYIQWESRSGAGVALPYAAIQVTNGA